VGSPPQLFNMRACAKGALAFGEPRPAPTRLCRS